ncbi:MAG: acyl-CoA dehydrogenase family protein [Dehalococcoidia bacterium]|nr:acyl-CoA dehydrogenase family protein [Dehalococcoidia bacterium]
MDFSLTEQQEMIRRTVRDIAQKVVAPRAAEMDRTAEYPWDIKEILAKQGLLGIIIPEEYGGVGADLLTACLIIEELAKVDASTACIMVGAVDGVFTMLIAANEDQRKRYFPRIATGEIGSAIAITEPGAGSDVAAMTSKAIREGDHYRLNGVKHFITMGGGVSELFTIFAITDPGKGAKSFSAFIVEKDYPGFTIGKHEDKMGVRAVPNVEIIMDDVKVPAANLLGKEGDGFKLVMQALDRARPGVAAQSVGIAQGALDFAVEYSKTRVQFGQPIGQFQGIQFMLADMATQVEAARYLTYRAATLIHDGAKEGPKFAAMAKVFASDMAMKVTTDAVQVVGGYGYMKDYPVERMMRDAKLMQLFVGTNQIQRMIIARTMVG